MEHFHSEKAFLSLIEQRKFASALSGLMKVYIDHDIYQEQNEKEKRFKQEAEIVEKHKAYAMAVANGAQLNPTILSKDPKASRDQGVLDRESGKHKSHPILNNPFEQPDRDFLQSYVSPRTESQQYELVLDSKRKSEDQYLSASRLLPKYDLERVKKLAMEAESGAKDSNTRVSRTYKPILKASAKFAEDHRADPRQSHDSKHDIHRSEPKETGTEQLYGDNHDRILPGSPASPSKLYTKRQEYKQKKSGQKSPAESPECHHEHPQSDNEKKFSFVEKMKNFDYSNLKRPRIEVENEISSKLAHDSLKRQLSREKKLEEYASKAERSEPLTSYLIGTGRYGYALSDEEGKTKNKQRTDFPLEYSDNEEDPLGFDSKTIPKKKDTINRHSSPGFPPKSPGQASVKSRSLSQKNYTVSENRTSTKNDESKKLVPLVPESQKQDVYAKVQRELNKREEENKLNSHKTKREPSPGPKLTDRETSLQGKPTEHARHSKEPRIPQLDHKNMGYVPAHQLKPKQFVKSRPREDYEKVSSSGYGRIEKSFDSKKKGRSGEGQGSRGPSPQYKDVRSLVDSILKEGKKRVAMFYTRMMLNTLEF